MVEDTVDLIATARSFDDAYGWISAAIGRRQTTADLLSKALAARSRTRWRAWVTGAVQDAVDGVHSRWSGATSAAWSAPTACPAARRQARRRHGSGNRYLDNLYEEFGLCVELDGAASHPAEGRWRDTRRDNTNLIQGNADAEIRMARRHRVLLPDRHGGRRDPGPSRLELHPAPVRPRLHRRPSASGGW